MKPSEAAYILPFVLIVTALISIIATQSLVPVRDVIQLHALNRTIDKQNHEQFELLSREPRLVLNLHAYLPKVTQSRKLLLLHAPQRTLPYLAPQQNFPGMMLDWNTVSLLPVQNCPGKTPRENKKYASRFTCSEVSAANQYIAGNLESSALLLQGYKDTKISVVVRGFLTINQIWIKEVVNTRITLIAAGDIDIGAIHITNSSDNELLFYTEGGHLRVEHLNEAATLGCAESNAAVAIAAIAAAGTWWNGTRITSSFNEDCRHLLSAPPWKPAIFIDS